MFVRIKTTPNSPRRSVQLVEGVRDRGKVRQRIVRHIGVAMDEDELERLRQLGEYVKAKLEQERQPLLFAPEKIAEQVIRVGRQGTASRNSQSISSNLRRSSVWSRASARSTARCTACWAWMRCCRARATELPMTRCSMW